MAGEEKGTAGKNALLAVGFGSLAGVTASILLAKKALATPGGVIDEATRQAIIAIAEANALLVADVEDLLTNVASILAAMPQGIPSNGGTPSSGPVVVVTKNVDGIQTRSVVIDALLRPIQLPSMPIPDGMSVLIKAWPAPPNVGIIYVAESREYSLDLNYITPLRPGEFISYRVKNASAIWVSGTAPGDRVSATAEKVVEE